MNYSLDDFLVARSMTRKAQYTSNLSSAENDCVENKVKRKKKKDTEIKKNERSLWSPESINITYINILILFIYIILNYCIYIDTVY